MYVKMNLKAVIDNKIYFILNNNELIISLLFSSYVILYKSVRQFKIKKYAVLQLIVMQNSSSPCMPLHYSLL